MPELDLTTDHSVLDNNASGAPNDVGVRSWNPVAGAFAVWIGLALICLRYFQVVIPFLLLLAPFFGIAYLLGGDVALVWTNLALSPVTLSFLMYFGFKFFFPAYWDIVRLAGLFGQRIARVRPADTIGVVSRRWEGIRTDGTNVMRWLRARI